MLKTLLITTDYPPKIGGVSEYLSQICRRLPEDEIVVLTTTEHNSADFDLIENYKIIRKNLLYSCKLVWPKWLKLLFSAYSTVKDTGCNQILVGQILPVGTVAMILNILFKIPYIVSTHAMDITILSNSQRKTGLAKKILKRSKKVITVSHYTRSKLIQLGVDKDKISIISPATDIYIKSNINKADEFTEKFGLTGKKIILTVGRIIERKGHLEVLKSLPEIIKAVPNVNYLITSEGPYLSVLKKYVKEQGLEQHVTFAGTISRDELASIYQIADIFIMPTRMLANNDVEGFGIVYLEANAFAKPVIAYNSGGVSDAVLHNKTGILVEPKNPHEIAKNVIMLFQDEEFAKKLGLNGKNRVLEEFNWDIKTKSFIEVLS